MQDGFLSYFSILNEISRAHLVVVPFAVGFAKIVRSTPWNDAFQARLEATWTKGKPINCWTCLTFWGSLLGALLLPGEHFAEPSLVALVTLGSTAVSSLLMGRVEPIPPAGIELPPIEDS